MNRGSAALAALVLLACFLAPRPVAALECDQSAVAQNHSGGGQVVCPCFVAGEQAGVVLSPSGVATDSLEILRVGIAWGSQFGGSPQSLEQAVHVYESGLPVPGAPVFSLVGPVLNDGFINEFDLATQGGPAVVANDDFMVALEFLNSNSSDLFAPSVVHDGSGCQAGRNTVRVESGSWLDACSLGVGGDWVMYAVYQPRCNPTGAPGELFASNRAVFLAEPSPNPASAQASLRFFLREGGAVELAAYDLRGRRVATLHQGELGAGQHELAWDGRGEDGGPLPAGRYFVRLSAAGGQSQRTLTLLR